VKKLDKKHFGKLLVTTAEIFEKVLSKNVLDLYFQALKKYSIEQIEDAISKAIISCKFFPKPVELIELMSGIGKLEDQAQFQVDIVLNAIKRVGGYQSVKFKDTITNTVINYCFGNWTKLCEELKENEEKWFRKDFIKYYQSYYRQNIRSDELLPGFISIGNKQNGYIDYIPDPVLIEGFEIDKIKLLQ